MVLVITRLGFDIGDKADGANALACADEVYGPTAAAEEFVLAAAPLGVHDGVGKVLRGRLAEHVQVLSVVQHDAGLHEVEELCQVAGADGDL